MISYLTEMEAFRAMVSFLDKYYERGNGIDTLGDVLSSMSNTIWKDGHTNDPAQWQDWLNAINEIKGKAG